MCNYKSVYSHLCNKKRCHDILCSYKEWYSSYCKESCTIWPCLTDIMCRYDTYFTTCYNVSHNVCEHGYDGLDRTSIILIVVFSWLGSFIILLLFCHFVYKLCLKLSNYRQNQRQNAQNVSPVPSSPPQNVVNIPPPVPHAPIPNPQQNPRQNLQTNQSVVRFNPRPNPQWVPLAPIQNPQEIQRAIDFHNQYVWRPPINNFQEIQQAIDFYNLYAGLPRINNSIEIQQALGFYNQLARLPFIQNLIEIQQAIAFYNHFAGQPQIQNPLEILQAVALANRNANIPVIQDPEEILQFISQLYQLALQDLEQLIQLQLDAFSAWEENEPANSRSRAHGRESQDSSRNGSVNQLHDCCICLENIRQENLRITICGHFFHEECLTEWIQSRGAQASCPICRTRIE